MSRHDSAPTHSWVITSRINKWLAAIFLFCLLIVFITIWTLTYTIRRDCTDVYRRDFEVAGYWLHVDAGSTRPECPQHDD
jgi:hypothetical protein